MLSGFLAQLPEQVYLCDTTQDCGAYYLRADSCEPPVILGILGNKMVGDNAGKLVPLQTAVRRFCPEPEIACAPVVVPFACVENRCVEVDPNAPSPQTTPPTQQSEGAEPPVPGQPVPETVQPESPPDSPPPAPVEEPAP